MFKAYDLRGKIPEITKEVFYHVGYSFVTEVLKKENLPLEVVVGFDTREYSEYFSRYVVKGINDAGGKAHLIGLSSTDFVYAASVEKNLPAIQLTASHNPREYHGVKIVKKAPSMVGINSGLAQIRDYVVSKIENGEIMEELAQTPVDENLRNEIKESFIKIIKEVGNTDQINQILSKKENKLRVVVDCGNGAGGVFMPWIEAMYPEIEFIRMYYEPDGTFPNHPADPQNYDNLKDLINTISHHGADFGVAFDGDADRCALVDQNGDVIPGDYLVSAFAANLLNEYNSNQDFQSKYKPVIVSIEPNSRCVFETIGENAGIGAICKQGHTYVKDKMLEFNAIYGGEYSNHHYFGVLKGMDSGALPVALFIKLLVESNQSASKMFEKYSSYYFVSELINITIPENQSFDSWKTILKNHYREGSFSYLDGISVYFNSWKFSMRSSNTEPVVRLILETRVEDLREKRLQELMQVLGL
jgi:phosphomannomutase